MRKGNKILIDAVAAAVLSVGVFVTVVACTTGNDVLVADDTSTVISNVRVIQFSNDIPTIQLGKAIVVDDGRITAVRDQRSVSSKNAANAIDGKGMTVIPGLSDMHVHIWDEAEFDSYLSYGITTVRNLSGMPFHIPLKQEIDSGERIAPRFLTTGPILNSTGPNAHINHQIVDTAAAATAAVRAQYENGFRDLKVYSNLTRDAYDAIKSEAALLGMTLSGHTPEGVRSEGMPKEKPFDISFEDILDDGFVTIEHVESIVWHGLREHHDELAARALARKIARLDVAVTPTLVAHHNLLRTAREKDDFINRPGKELLNPFVLEAEQETISFWRSRPTENLATNDAFYKRVTEIFNEEGVTMVAGTDAGIFLNVPGKSLMDELALLVEAGLSPYDALKTATYNPAKVLNEENERGQIAEGFIADLVFYECDPLSDISCVENPAGVMLRGNWFDHPALTAMRDAAANPPYERTQTNVMAGLAAQGSVP